MGRALQQVPAAVDVSWGESGDAGAAMSSGRSLRGEQPPAAEKSYRVPRIVTFGTRAAAKRQCYALMHIGRGLLWSRFVS